MFLDGSKVIDQVGGMDQSQLEEKCKKYGTPKKGEPRVVDVQCTLEELFTGRPDFIFTSVFCCRDRQIRHIHTKKASNGWRFV